MGKTFLGAPLLGTAELLGSPLPIPEMPNTVDKHRVYQVLCIIILLHQNDVAVAVTKAHLDGFLF